MATHHEAITALPKARNLHQDKKTPTFQQDPAFMAEFGHSFNNCDIPKVDADFDPDSFDG